VIPPSHARRISPVPFSSLRRPFLIVDAQQWTRNILHVVDQVPVNPRASFTQGFSFPNIPVGSFYFFCPLWLGGRCPCFLDDILRSEGHCPISPSPDPPPPSSPNFFAWVACNLLSQLPLPLMFLSLLSPDTSLVFFFLFSLLSLLTRGSIFFPFT